MPRAYDLVWSCYLCYWAKVEERFTSSPRGGINGHAAARFRKRALSKQYTLPTRRGNRHKYRKNRARDGDRLNLCRRAVGPSAARPLRRGAGRPVPNTVSFGGGLAEGNGSAFNWLSRARRAPSDFPSPVAPPPSCELVATRGRETRERSAGAGLALASQALDSRSTRPGLGSCGCVGQ